MFGLSTLKLGLLGMSLALVLGGFTGCKLQSGKIHKLETRLAAETVRADKWKTAADGWKAAYGRSEVLRSQETGQAINAVNEASRACNQRVAQVRASADRLRDLMRRPVKVDAAGCPVRALWGADDLRGVLQPGVR